MSKAFVKESDQDEELEQPEILPENFKNYVTPTGFNELQEELREFTSKRSKVVEKVRWAAGNGDRSENGDYIYGKKHLREIDKRIRYLTKRLESAVVIDPKKQVHLKRVHFGATVTYVTKTGKKTKVTIVGIDEANVMKEKVSWISPIAKAILKSQVGDYIDYKTPASDEIIEIIAIEYIVR